LKRENFQNPKLEVRNKFKFQNGDVQNYFVFARFRFRSLRSLDAQKSVVSWFSNFPLLEFEFVSNFGFKLASSFRFG
jgi:hypothetical protein